MKKTNLNNILSWSELDDKVDTSLISGKYKATASSWLA